MKKPNIATLVLALESMSLSDLKVVKRHVDIAFRRQIKNLSSKNAVKNTNQLKPPLQREHNLQQLLDQDWSYLFDGYEKESKDCFVYFHGDPRKSLVQWAPLNVKSFQRPIYVGMGRGDRHQNFKRSPLHTEKIKELEDRGFSRDSIAHIVAGGLSEADARELESKLILFFGIKSVAQKKSIRKNNFSMSASCLINAQYEPMPEGMEQYRF